MIKGIRIRIYPNKHQKELIAKTFGCCRLVYNKGLALRKDIYELTKHNVGYKETCAWLTELKHTDEFAFLKEVDSMALQQSLHDLDNAYQNFFKLNQGFPKFKSKHHYYPSYRTQNVTNGIYVSMDSKYIRLPKLGYVRSKVSYNLSNIKINNATIRQTPSGKYFCTLNVDVDIPKNINKGENIGIDLGVNDFYIDSNGNKCSNNRFLQKSQKKLTKEQRRLSHMIESHIVNYKVVNGYRHPIYDKPLSECKNIQKQRIKVARVHEHIANQRNDFLQKQSTRLVSENQVIGIEDLSVKNMVRNHKLAKSISDVSWSKFVFMLEYKAQIYGTEIIKVPRFYASSQLCSCCGHKNPAVKNLSIRNWTCPICNTYHDRDINAATNILNKALEIKYEKLGI